ncbi:hypothetical protein [Vibrio diabolicus]|uniref:hypothetical protein n=1 Tax=Vibrio diabolicus TaxID=50719 RepID=UPI000A8180B4|nr:hypothetical protein [Vibrio diabolicus]MCS0433590.1 hypothetical protein [Vibrio diabolicus]
MLRLVNIALQIVGIRTAKQKEKTQRVVDYIDTCLEHMENIMGYKKDINEASVEQSRKFLQQAYRELPLQLDGVASTVECDVIKNSIASARIYYHAVKEGKVLDSSLENDYESRFQLYVNNVYDQQLYRQNSYETFLRQLVKDKREIDKAYVSMELQKIKEVCQEDVARIMSSREQLKTRKAA